MHRILEIAIGVGLGMTIFLVILWILGTAVYICCGKTKRIASVRKLKNFSGEKTEPAENLNADQSVPAENLNADQSVPTENLNADQS
jgi:hypothetical protein